MEVRVCTETKKNLSGNYRELQEGQVLLALPSWSVSKPHPPSLDFKSSDLEQLGRVLVAAQTWSQFEIKWDIMKC